MRRKIFVSAVASIVIIGGLQANSLDKSKCT